MVEIKHSVIVMLARAIHLQLKTVYPDGLVMRVGTGWEFDNPKAIDAWLRACHPQESPATWYTPLEYLVEVGVDQMLKQELGSLRMFLRTQSEQLWEGSCYSYPKPVPHMAQLELTADHVKLMAHAHLEMLATYQPIHEVIDHCWKILPGTGDGVRKLRNWIVSQQACYTHHPSELTMPLAHDLLRVLYPDFQAHR
ncbi:hypothetical protein [Spongiibacter sp. UBA1325]|jgi:hypothetical protein|uniref:hypothetical protein n=1 Tax=Spongiibacter sp. UBA1325 TaxID=1947543 RepID=UPI00257D079C|nr:hypothetical protein [Spongiibacter sp. UBA1325]|tara:strand:+ start:3541 stop:4128 length:588 start_codon:yes stop_codon:yes gene_type:complete